MVFFYSRSNHASYSYSYLLVVLSLIKFYNSKNVFGVSYCVVGKRIETRREEFVIIGSSFKDGHIENFDDDLSIYRVSVLSR